MISLAIDILSRYLIGSTADLSDPEKDEVARRIVHWMYYFLRSPFYEAAARYYCAFWVALYSHAFLHSRAPQEPKDHFHSRSTRIPPAHKPADWCACACYSAVHVPSHPRRTADGIHFRVPAALFLHSWFHLNALYLSLQQRPAGVGRRQSRSYLESQFSVYKRCVIECFSKLLTDLSEVFLFLHFLPPDMWTRSCKYIAQNWRH